LANFACKVGFRHGIFKKDGKQIPPHSSKAECDKWVERGEIYGCGKPFKVVEDSVKVAITCEYI
jgi:hypothetical protein